MKQDKPRLSKAAIWNMSMGFLGIQFGFALQNGNASRILQTFGADVEHLSLFWLAAPLTGIIVQPIIGHYSDRTWNKLGRRKPYFLAGAILTALALVLLPNAGVMAALLPPIAIGAGMLMIMDASINVAMEPFRALVGDKLPDAQRSAGFSVQTFLIGLGAVIGSAMPYWLDHYLGVAKTDDPGVVPRNVIYSFYIGAFVLIATILWTIFSTKEYSPEEMRSFEGDAAVTGNDTSLTLQEAPLEAKRGLGAIFSDFANMPKAMRQLGLVQFFSWFALFSMWVFTTPAIAEYVYHTLPGDTSSAVYADASNRVNVMFSVYNGVSAVYALLLPMIAGKTSRKFTHAFSLIAGGVGLISIYFIQNPAFLVIPMIGVGLAWGSILAMPYAILSSTLPPRKMGVYMGIFNFFITFPQIVNGIFGGMIVKHLYGGQTIYAVVMAGVFMLLAALSVMYVQDKEGKVAG